MSRIAGPGHGGPAEGSVDRAGSLAHRAVAVAQRTTPPGPTARPSTCGRAPLWPGATSSAAPRRRSRSADGGQNTAATLQAFLYITGPPPSCAWPLAGGTARSPRPRPGSISVRDVHRSCVRQRRLRPRRLPPGQGYGPRGSAGPAPPRRRPRRNRLRVDDLDRRAASRVGGRTRSGLSTMAQAWTRSCPLPAGLVSSYGARPGATGTLPGRTKPLVTELERSSAAVHRQRPGAPLLRSLDDDADVLLHAVAAPRRAPPYQLAAACEDARSALARRSSDRSRPPAQPGGHRLRAARCGVGCARSLVASHLRHPTPSSGRAPNLRMDSLTPSELRVVELVAEGGATGTSLSGSSFHAAPLPPTSSTCSEALASPGRVDADAVRRSTSG